MFITDNARFFFRQKKLIRDKYGLELLEAVRFISERESDATIDLYLFRDKEGRVLWHEKDYATDLDPELSRIVDQHIPEGALPLEEEREDWKEILKKVQMLRVEIV